jgi:hypothetical protein
MRRIFVSFLLLFALVVAIVPTVAAQEVPPATATFPAEDPEQADLKDVEVPGWVMTVLGWFSQKYVLPFSAALAAALVTVVGLLRQILAVFGARLGPKGIYIATALLAFLSAFAAAGSDGSIAGEEWTAVVTALAAFIAAILGYRLTFSGSARARLGKGY